MSVFVCVSVRVCVCGGRRGGRRERGGERGGGGYDKAVLVCIFKKWPHGGHLFQIQKYINTRKK